ncbi:MAG: hypothetical protein LBN93_09410 [Candidatus Symbiothrix sp.]|jgi:hypothetical protein|nr:hypothetical protein [Candidatus Symbiothrix sp.]
MKHILYLLLVPILFIACDDTNGNPGGNPGAETLSYRDGITRISDDSLAFVLFAPKKQSVYLIGDFTHWQPLLPRSCLLCRDQK